MIRYYWILVAQALVRRKYIVRLERYTITPPPGALVLNLDDVHAFVEEI